LPVPQIPEREAFAASVERLKAKRGRTLTPAYVDRLHAGLGQVSLADELARKVAAPRTAVTAD
jgi:hypothetical protein